MKAKAPWIDRHLFRFHSRPVVVGPGMQTSLPDLFEAISPVRPEGEDEVRQIWIRAERGTLEDYGDFEESRRFQPPASCASVKSVTGPMTIFGMSQSCSHQWSSTGGWLICAMVD